MYWRKRYLEIESHIIRSPFRLEIVSKEIVALEFC